VLLKRAGREGETSYRTLIEDRIRQGEEESLLPGIRWGLVLGAERFAKKVRGRIRVSREHENLNELKKRCTFDEIVQCVERIKGEKWDDFRDRYGDWGRDLALWGGSRFGGLTLGALGKAAGGMDYSAVSMCIRRLEARARHDRNLRALTMRVATQCS